MTRTTLLSITGLSLLLSACSSEPSSTAQTAGAKSTGGTSAASSTASSAESGGQPSASTGGKSSSTSSSGVGGHTNTGGISTQSTPKTATGGASAGTGGTPASSIGGKSSSVGGASSSSVPTSAAGGSSGSSGGSAAGGHSSQPSNTGGSASGGSSPATGGSTTSSTDAGGSAPEVQLITSSKGDYFNTTHAATVVTSGTADLTIDETAQFQHWDGFGGTFNEMGWDALSVLSATEVTSALTLLFDANDGANFVYGRIPLGASDYSMSWFTYDDATSPDYSMKSFSVARDEQKLIPFIKAALKVRSDIRLWASPWVVPGWMMSNSNMKADAQTLTAHALYMAKFVEEYAKRDLPIWAIHPQNEPGYARVHWTSSDLINFIKTYLGPTFEQRNLTTEIWCGTMSKHPDDSDIALAAANDPQAMKYIKGFGVQWNPLPAVAELAAKAPVMQTEHRCGNYNFDTDYWNTNQYNSSKAQNDHTYGEETWQLLRDWIMAGVNSYSAWNMVLDTAGKSLDGWPQNALLVVDRSTKKLTATAAYYAFRHYSQFILPGATRISATSSSAGLKGLSTESWNGLNAVAFKNTDGSIVTEVYNKGTSAQTLTVKVAGSLYQIAVPAHGWDTLRIQP